MAKRASMREGPLADLFRSTGESVEVDEVKVTVSKTSKPSGKTSKPSGKTSKPSGKTSKPAGKKSKGASTKSASKRSKRVKPKADVVVVEPEEIEEIEVERIEAPPIEERRIVTAPETSEPEEEILEPEEEMIVEPARDPAIEEIERRETRNLQITEDVEVEHEGLERLMGNQDSEEIRPAFGRDEPDTARFATVPRSHQAVLRVVGVGGAGVNAVNRMVEAQVPGVEFVAINTDLQSLQTSGADVTLHIGADLTRGLGSGSDPRVGYRAAFDEQDKIKQLLKGSDMVFLAAGAGGGTGTGAAPVVAKLARDVGALTVAAVTKPFGFEGARRAAQAEEGIAALGSEVDTLIVIPNERLLEILERRTSIQDAFRVADDVLRQAVQGISDLVMLPGLINLDFADVRTTMLDAGDAILGIGMGVGEHRAQLAAEKAVASPLLDTNVEGAHSLLLSITGGPDLSLIEASEAAEIVREAAHADANIIFGATVDEEMAEEVWITVIATRFDSAFAHRHRRRDRRDGPREPAGRDSDRDRYSDPAGDWRGEGPGDGRKARLKSADEIYGEGSGRGQDRRPTPPGMGGTGGLVLDVPEFIPGH